MPTIRQLLEGKELSFASPLAQHVSTHMQDPVGATKDQFGKLQKAKLNYDLAREETQRNLAPVQSVITHLSQMHGLQPDMPTPAMGQAGQGANSMGDPQDGQVDENGNPIDPNEDPNNPQPPQNMDQTVGKMNQNRPSLAGHQPGVAPMMEKQVVPPKLGMASPGKPQARNSPAPNPQQYNRQAAPPKGNRSLPGAKGPGDAKVANRSQKALSNSPGRKQQKDSERPRPIKVTVHAATSIPRNTVSIEDSMGLASLKFRGEIKANKGSAPIGPGGALGPSGVMPMAVPKTGQPIKSRGMKALDELSDKVSEPGHDVALNPVTSLKSKGHGTSHGAKKGWSTRGKGHLSATEKSAHHATLDLCAKCGGLHAVGTKCIKAGGPGSGRHPGYGGFNFAFSHRNRDGSLEHTWTHPAGHTVYQTVERNGSHNISEASGKEGSKSVYSGRARGASDFMESRYGIRDAAGSAHGETQRSRW